MIKKLPALLLVFLFFASARDANATEFDELDKPPEGAHEGQFLLGAFFTLGWPKSSLIDAEDEFLEGSTYTFDNDITKKLQVSHQSFSFGLNAEYQPVNHFGCILRFRRTYLVQNTAFGSDYENWKGYLYRDYSVYLGPAIHATSRKVWDFVLTPVIGYAFGEYNATPVAKKTIDGYSGESSIKTSGLTYGAELNCTIYFTGGLYVSFGGEWIRNTINLGDGFALTNPQTDNTYNADGSSSIDTYSIIISAGYAFSN
ncbi:MAG: hypothetical protein JW864_19090 [Spirochaetes bacterium]|nr:hypothetical protein [Spirochaetota bacterium]